LAADAPATMVTTTTASWHSRRSDHSMADPRERRSSSSLSSSSSSSRRETDRSRAPGEGGTARGPAVLFGPPALDAGTKYVQRIGPLTPQASVVPLAVERDLSSCSSSGRTDDDGRHRHRRHHHRHHGSGSSSGKSKHRHRRGARHHRHHRHHRRDASSAGEDDGAVAHGARMEDSALVVSPLGGVGGGATALAVVADGHGSVPMVSCRMESRDPREPTVFVGGPECAALAASSVARYLRRVADFVDLGQLAREGVACVLRDAFLFAQRVCAEETERGCLDDGQSRAVAGASTPSMGGPLPSGSSLSSCSSSSMPQSSSSSSSSRGRSRAERGRRRVGGGLDRSAIDGAYFARVRACPREALPEAGDPRALVVVDKVRVPYRPVATNGAVGREGHLVYYVAADGRRALAEYGTTLTAVLVTPLLPSDVRRGRARGGAWAGRAFVAHAGDSDVFLFHWEASRRAYVPVRLTDDHTVTNAAEVARLTPYGFVVDGHYFRLTTGPEAGQMLMPSRSLGHVLLSQHRIACVPSIATTLVAPGDVVVAATDGLWGGYGTAGGWSRPSGEAAAGASPEALSAARVAALLDAVAGDLARGALSPGDIARAIRDDLVRHVTRRRDNASIVVGLCPTTPPPRCASSVPSASIGVGAPSPAPSLSSEWSSSSSSALPRPDVRRVSRVDPPVTVRPSSS
jgi:serine/threonine protein phosphatase PrpC